MYAWVWRHLPGRWPLKTLEALVAVSLISVVLVVLVFPWIEPKLPFSDNTVTGGGGASSSVPATPAPSLTPTVAPTAGTAAPTVLPGD